MEDQDERFPSFKNCFLSALEACEREEKARKERKFENMPLYGVDFLNDTCFGILPSELVVVGAETGRGKSQMANDIAIKNTENGKRVYLFSLEGDEDEVISRARWQSICKDYYENPTGQEMSYQKYIMNQIDGLEEYEQNFRNKMAAINNNLFIYDRKAILDLETLSQKISLIREADLIILDHLHYLSLDDDRESSQLTKVMRTIKDITEIRKIPFLVISHLRKKQKDRGLLPDTDDFHGTSNIAKIATTCITISPNSDLSIPERGFHSTIFQVLKSRIGAPKHYVGNVFYDTNKNSYSQGYHLYKIFKNELKKVDYEHYPSWAKNFRGMPHFDEFSAINFTTL